jgi:N-acetyl sugar amidotransferase
MIKILILSYYYHPANFVGAERIDSFAKHLHKFGVYPIIVTRNWNPNQTNTYEKIHENSFKHNVYDTHEEYYMPYEQSWRDKLFGKTCIFCALLRRLLTLFELVSSSFSINTLPYSNLFTQARTILNKDSDIKAIVISGSPFESFHFGYLLKKEIPRVHWIPDYRDEWTTFQGIKPIDFISKLKYYMDQQNEKKWVSNCTQIISVSDNWVKNIGKFIGKDGFRVMNGYELDLFQEEGEYILKDNELVLTYNGTIYQEQDFSLLSGAICKIIEDFEGRMSIRVKFIGTDGESIYARKIIELFGHHSTQVEFIPRIPKREIIPYLKTSDVFIMTSYSSIKGVYPVKLFDYYLAERPIILCPSDHSNIEEFIKETNCGFVFNNSQDCYDKLFELIDIKLSNKVFKLDVDRIKGSLYSREHQASILAEKIKSLSSFYQICKRCVMDTSDEDIVFDEQGICQHCRDFEKVLQQPRYQKDDAKERLADMILTIKAKGKKYDCLVGISGGVDSCYTAYLCHKWGLNPLLLHMDNGWNSEIAVSNIEKLVDKLGLDYISYVLDWNEFREIQLAFLKSSIVDLELPTDIAIPASLYETAVKYDIPFIMSGGNYSGEGILPLTWGYHVLKDANLYRTIVKHYTNTPLKKIPVVGLWGEIYYKFFKQIKTLYPLNLVDYNKDEAREFLKNEFGWTDYGGKHHESKITAFWQSYAMPTKYNMDYRRATYSSQIVSGQITREEALEKLKELPYNPESIPADKEYIAKKFGIPLSELESYLALPPKTYKDFPNQKKLIQWFYRIYKKYLG